MALAPTFAAPAVQSAGNAALAGLPAGTGTAGSESQTEAHTVADTEADTDTASAGLDGALHSQPEPGSAAFLVFLHLF